MLVEAGFRWIPFSFSRRGLNPVAELATVLRLAKIYRRERPDLVHHFTIKCVLYGSLASRMAGIRGVANSVPGLGHVFADDGWRMRMIRPVIKRIYKHALRGTQVIFQNPDDRREFIEQKLTDDANHHLIMGSGVDVSRFRPGPRPSNDSRKVVLFASRLLWSKGVREYVEAAAIVRKAIPTARLLIAGEPDAGNPDAVSVDKLHRLAAQGDVELLGHREHMEELLGSVNVVVLPSYYREGTPRILVEAASCGLPLVATDAPGCREIVRHGLNGLLVPAKDPQALAEAIKTLLRDEQLCATMGGRSRQIACDEFSEESVIERTLTVYEQAIAGSPARK